MKGSAFLKRLLVSFVITLFVSQVWAFSLNRSSVLVLMNPYMPDVTFAQEGIALSLQSFTSILPIPIAVGAETDEMELSTPAISKQLVKQLKNEGRPTIYLTVFGHAWPGVMMAPPGFRGGEQMAIGSAFGFTQYMRVVSYATVLNSIARAIQTANIQEPIDLVLTINACYSGSIATSLPLFFAQLPEGSRLFVVSGVDANHTESVNPEGGKFAQRAYRLLKQILTDAGAEDLYFTPEKFTGIFKSIIPAFAKFREYEIKKGKFSEERVPQVFVFPKTTPIALSNEEKALLAEHINPNATYLRLNGTEEEPLGPMLANQLLLSVQSKP